MLKRMAVFIFLMMIVFQSILLSQFHVKPMVEMMFTYETGVQYFIDKVSLVGKNNTYSVEILGSKQKCFYDVKPGTYFVIFESKNKIPLFSSFVVTLLFDVELNEPTEEAGYQNVITVNENRNYMMDIQIKASSTGSYIEKEAENKFADFDYVKLVYYMESTINTVQAELKEQFVNTKKSNTIQNKTTSTTDQTITVPINKECTGDDGNINVKIENAIFIDNGTIEENATTGTNGVGKPDPKEPNKEGNGEAMGTDCKYVKIR